MTSVDSKPSTVNNYQTWVAKYRPKKFEDIIGQDEAIEKIKTYFEKFPKVKKKALLLGGSPGIGKTTLVEVLANEIKAELFELNASDFRNKAQMQEKLKPVLEQTSLFNNKKLILIDEADGVSGTKDRGGLSELTSLIENSPFPIICTANDVWGKKVSGLKKKCEIIELKEISPSQTKDLLKKILELEGKEVTLGVLNKIAIHAKGDLRSAINDLEAASSLEHPEDFEIDSRNKKEDIFNAIKIIFQEKANPKMLGLYDKVDMPLDEIMLWIEENIPKVYSGEELVRAYQRLANADLFKGRIYKQQYWRFLVYENIFSSYGISAAKGDTEKKGLFKYERPGRVLKIWLNNVKHAKRKSIAIKFSKQTHVGMKRIMKEWKEVLPFLKNPKIQEELKLEADEIAYIMKY
ncbi:MAG: replication factor C large subunit [Nanoarchaeota archaeon]|jgi:replication factor C large subunit|nr:replication factor C large subunit [Nanoarchaeota archaeon]